MKNSKHFPEHIYIPYLDRLQQSLASDCGRGRWHKIRRRLFKSAHHSDAAQALSKQSFTQQSLPQQALMDANWQIPAQHQVLTLHLYECAIEHSGIRVDRVLAKSSWQPAISAVLNNALKTYGEVIENAQGLFLVSAQGPSEHWPNIVDLIGQNLFSVANLQRENIAFFQIINEAQMMLKNELDIDFGVWLEPVSAWHLETANFFYRGIGYWLQADRELLLEWFEQLPIEIESLISGADNALALCSEDSYWPAKVMNQWLVRKGIFRVN
ncbi:MAG: hypothetical protein HWE13_14425 [Gammaproteobacteria bacterium]|nr:hypothetical protein [Gammaproteobacteria bacterium]